MFENLEIFRMAQALAAHAGARQSVVAQNIANADTPGYKALDVAPFEDLYQPATRSGGSASGRNDMFFGASGAKISFEPDGNPASPNGNSVSLENEMVKAVDVKRQHDQALAIYKSSMTILRASIGRR